MKARTFRLSDEDIKLIDELQLELGGSKTDAIRFAIHAGMDAIRNTQGVGDSGTDGSAVSEAVSALTAQLAAKDEQIATLGEALRDAQRTAQAAQMLHAQERAAIEDGKKRRWRFPWSRGKE